MESPAQWQPRLQPWQHGWRFAAMLLISLPVTLVSLAEISSEHQGLWIAADLVLGALALALVHLRRRWPVAVALTISAFSMVSASAAGPGILAAVSVATRRRWTEVVAVGAGLIASSLVYSVVVPGGSRTELVFELFASMALSAALLGWGMYLGSRRELVWALRQRAERAEGEQALRAAQAKINERTRIAREMHDVLAHRISQIAMQSGALAYRVDLGQDELRQGVRDIQDQAHRALTDLRGVLGVLRNLEPGDPEDRPQPTFADVAALIEGCRVAGAKIEYAEAVSGPVPETLGRTVYRIIQESLTNAAKHAPGANVSVTVTGDPSSGMAFSVTNPLPVRLASTATPGAGLGLVGLAERADLAGGTFAAGRSGDIFDVRGWLPWVE